MFFLFITNNDLKYFTLILPGAFAILKYNQMMSYIEKNAYNQEDNN